MAFLNPADTIAVKHIVDGVVDNVFKNDPVLAKMKSGSLEPYRGGPSWQENFLFGMLNVSSYSPGDTFDISQQQIATGATVTPRYYNVPVPAYAEKIKIELNGPEAVFNYVDLLLQAASMSMSAQLAVDLYKEGTSATRTTKINGLEEALSDGTTNGPSGGTFTTYLTLTRNDANIGSALNSPMTNPAANVAGAISYPVLEQAWNSVVIGDEKPNLMVTTNNGMSYIKMAFEAQHRYEKDNPDLGFSVVRFNGTEIVQSQYAPGAATPSTVEAAKLGISALSGETLWFLNTKYLRLYVSTDPLYGFGFTGFIPAQNNSVLVGHYKFAGNFTCTAPRLQRVLYGITG